MIGKRVEFKHWRVSPQNGTGVVLDKLRDRNGAEYYMIGGDNEISYCVGPEDIIKIFHERKNKGLDREVIHERYMEKVNRISDECDWKTHFEPKEIVGLVCDVIEDLDREQ